MSDNPLWFDMPDWATLNGRPRRVYAVWHQYEISREDKAVADPTETMNFQLRSDTTAYADIGGYIRDRHVPRPPLGAAVFRREDARRSIADGKAAGLDGFCWNRTGVMPSPTNSDDLTMKAVMRESGAMGTPFAIPGVDIAAYDGAPAQAVADYFIGLKSVPELELGWIKFGGRHAIWAWQPGSERWSSQMIDGKNNPQYNMRAAPLPFWQEVIAKLALGGINNPYLIFSHVRWEDASTAVGQLATVTMPFGKMRSSLPNTSMEKSQVEGRGQSTPPHRGRRTTLPRTGLPSSMISGCRPTPNRRSTSRPRAAIFTKRCGSRRSTKTAVG